MENKVEIALCVGSACHLEGSHEVIEAIKNEVKNRGLEDSVLLKAAFCLGKCGNGGVTVKVGEDILPGVTLDQVPSLFEDKVLPALGR